MARFYSLGRVGQFDIAGMVRRGALPPSALDVECQRALIHAMSFEPELLEFTAYGNEDRRYAEVCQAEIARRERLDAEA